MLLDLVFQHLELVEKDYFGLQYLETNRSQINSHLLHFKNFHLNSSNSSTSNQQNETEFRKWIDNGKLLKHQLKFDSSFTLYFKVRFFVSDPSKLNEDTRYHLFLQIRNDILESKLVYSHSSLVKLSSYVVQCKSNELFIIKLDANFSLFIFS